MNKLRPWVKMTLMLVVLLGVVGVFASISLFNQSIDKRVSALENRPMQAQKVLVTPEPTASPSATPFIQKKVTRPTPTVSK